MATKTKKGVRKIGFKRNSVTITLNITFSPDDSVMHGVNVKSAIRQVVRPVLMGQPGENAVVTGVALFDTEYMTHQFTWGEP